MKRMITYKASVLVFGLLIASFGLQAQRIDEFGNLKKIKMSGGVSFNQSLYYASGIDSRFNPYSYVLSGNLNFDIWGIAVPLSFTYSNQNLSYTRQSFNVVGLSPTYKDWTFHGGYRSMSFSKYSLSGHTYLGGGVEYKKDKWTFKTMGGRLLRGVEYDTTNNVPPSYDRWGGGFQVSYTDKGNSVAFNTFHALDLESSIAAFPESEGVRPGENQVYSLSLKRKLSSKLSWTFEGARSGTTSDRRDSSTGDQKILSAVYFLSNTTNTSYSNAFNTSFNWSLEKLKFGAAFERVDPDYTTMGAYYMNADFQNVTLNASRPILKKKVQNFTKILLKA